MSQKCIILKPPAWPHGPCTDTESTLSGPIWLVWPWEKWICPLEVTMSSGLLLNQLFMHLPFCLPVESKYILTHFLVLYFPLCVCNSFRENVEQQQRSDRFRIRLQEERSRTAWWSDSCKETLVWQVRQSHSNILKLRNLEIKLYLIIIFWWNGYIRGCI